jgi:hypothetical protein
MEVFFHLRFAAFTHVWMLIKGYVNQLCGETPTDDLHMGFPSHVTNFGELSGTLTEMQAIWLQLTPFTSPDKTRVSFKIGW